MVKKKGIVWNYFTKKIHGSQIVAFCKFCDQSYIQNATRMEKHIERCDKCPEDVRKDFMRLVRNKRAKSLITMKLAENWSMQEKQHLQNHSLRVKTPIIVQNSNVSLSNLTEWQNDGNDSANLDVQEINEDSKSWNQNIQFVPVETNDVGQQEEPQNFQADERSENVNSSSSVIDEIPMVPESVNIRRSKRSSQLPLLSSRSSSNLFMLNKIQQEQFLEKRALRKIAELELQRKTLEFEKFQWMFQVEKTQNEIRWAHECRMMQLKEEQQQELLKKHASMNT